MMEHQTKRLNALTYITALVLLAAALATTAGTFAAYRFSATGTDSARVAKWDVQLIVKDGVKENFYGEFDENNTEVIEYPFSVRSASEVAAEYSVTVEFSKPLDATITPSIGEANSESVIMTPNGNRTNFTFTCDAWTFPPAGGSNAHTLTLTRRNEMPESFDDIKVSISVTAEQID